MIKFLHGLCRTLEINIVYSRKAKCWENVAHWSISEALFPFCRGRISEM